MTHKDEFEVTPAMRDYLAAFDTWLRSGGETADRATGSALQCMYRDRDLIPPSLRERQARREP